MTNRKFFNIKTMAKVSILAAIAFILMEFDFPIPFIAPPFDKLEFSEVAVLIGGFAMGPLPGVAVVVIKNLVHMLGTSTACVGEMADIIMSSCFIIPASLIYRRRKDRKSAVLSMAVGTVLMTIAGVLVNYFILIPAYQTLMNLPLEVIVGMGTKVWSYIDNTVKLVIFITAPFNILKGAVLSVVTYLLYKRVSPLLHQKSAR